MFLKRLSFFWLADCDRACAADRPGAHVGASVTAAPLTASAGHEIVTSWCAARFALTTLLGRHYKIRNLHNIVQYNNSNSCV